MLVIKRPNGDVISFSVIRDFDEKFQSQVTSHPVDGASDVTDHVIIQNNKFSIKGFVTNDDFLGYATIISKPQPSVTTSVGATVPFDTGSSLLNALEAKAINFATDYVKNLANEAISGVLNKLGIGGVLSYTTPRNPNLTATAIKEALKDVRQNSDLCQIIVEGYKGNGNVPTTYSNCVISDLSFDEDQDTGDGYKVSITFEQLRIVPLVMVEVKAQPATSGKKKKGDSGKTNTAAQASSEANKGKQTVPQSAAYKIKEKAQSVVKDVKAALGK